MDAKLIELHGFRLRCYPSKIFAPTCVSAVGLEFKVAGRGHQWERPRLQVVPLFLNMFTVCYSYSKNNLLAFLFLLTESHNQPPTDGFFFLNDSRGS